jgi:hypothetical protein
MKVLTTHFTVFFAVYDSVSTIQVILMMVVIRDRAKPRLWVLTVAVWVGELELAGQERLGSVAGESQRYEGLLLNSFQLLWEV